MQEGDVAGAHRTDNRPQRRYPRLLTLRENEVRQPGQQPEIIIDSESIVSSRGPMEFMGNSPRSISPSNWRKLVPVSFGIGINSKTGGSTQGSLTTKYTDRSRPPLVFPPPMSAPQLAHLNWYSLSCPGSDRPHLRQQPLLSKGEEHLSQRMEALIPYEDYSACCYRGSNQ